MPPDRRIGVFTFQAIPFADLLDDVRFAEELGVHTVWLADQAVPPTWPILEAWTALAGLAAATERIRLGTNVTNVAMRNPMILARQALTVDGISAGRLEVGIGAGYYEGDHTSVGIDFLDGKGRVRRLVEAAEILDQALRGGPVSYQGEIYQTTEAAAIPPPAQSPRPPLWIAGRARDSMGAAVRLAEGFPDFGEAGLTTDETLAAYRERTLRLDEACLQAGRDPATLRRSYLAGFADEAVFSSRDSMADFVGRFCEAGVTDFIFTLHNPGQPGLDAGLRSGRYADRDALAALVTEVVPSLA